MQPTAEFFFYNTFKVFILVIVIGFIIGIIRELITPDRTREILSNKKAGTGNILSSILAVITPVESFSVIPVCIGFLETGIPAGITFTYLITAPMTNELAFALFWGLFGYKVALLYYAAGIIIGLIGGFIIGLLNLDKYIQPLIIEERKKLQYKREAKGFRNIITVASRKSWSFFRSFWLYIVIGVGIAAIVQDYTPTEFFVKYAGDNPYAIPVFVLMIIPFYINIAVALPIIMILVTYNLPVGTIIAFTMAVTATSLPELLILKRALKLPLLVIYMEILLILIILTGYLLNFILNL